MPDSPWTDVTFTGVYWNDPDRVQKLLEYVRPWFKHVVVGVQTDDPDHDETLKRALAVADDVIVDRVAGHCEPTIGKVLARVPTEWSFLVSADEWPSLKLLEAFQRMLNKAHGDAYDGFWVRMISSIEDIPYPSEQDNHLRVFKTRLGWPNTLHSRPPTARDMFWDAPDYLSHDRSLDEMMQDYIRYTAIGAGNSGWDAHNRLMMHDACAATASYYGWEHVKAFAWWPTVRALAFEDKEPI